MDKKARIYKYNFAFFTVSIKQAAVFLYVTEGCGKSFVRCCSVPLFALLSNQIYATLALK